MKIKSEYTVTLEPSDLAGLRMYYEEMKDEGETFRDFIKSNLQAFGEAHVFHQAAEYWSHCKSNPNR